MTAIPPEDGSDTAGADYAERLRRRSGSKWKQLLDVQRPYRWNLRRLGLGRTLDVGCGIGRNLHNLGAGSVGVDHNADAIRTARGEGLDAYTTEEFWRTSVGTPGSFDSMLVAHVLEHVSYDVANSMLREYLPCVRAGGQIVLITPQEAGYQSDPTHVRFVDLDGLREHVEAVGLRLQRAYSFPFPRVLGRVFTYNEFVCVATVR
jgi:2-polyprenyl-3-methyl-5-hydroxy-6-metoxy-1,4-benzoquinol methylase